MRARFNPARLGVYMTYIMAAAAMFLYGYYIENDETKFGAGALPAARAVGDQFLRGPTSSWSSGPSR